MLLGKIVGLTTTKEFGFIAEARIKKLDYVSIKDSEGKWVLGIIDRIIAERGKTKGYVKVIGYRDKRGFLQTPRIPFSPDTPVYAAEGDFIKKILGISDKGAYMGLLEGYDIRVYLPVEHLIKKHIAVLAKTGAGKSYVAGVLLEEFAENGVPAVVIDPHGEYHTLSKENKNQKELRFMERFGIEPKSYQKQVKVFGINKGKPIKLNSKLSAEEIISMLPKVTEAQKGIIYSVVKSMEKREYTLRDVIDEVLSAKSNAKWNLASMLESLANTRLFSANPTGTDELVKKNQISILDLSEAKPELQSIVVMKIADELFAERKRGKIPAFILVVEEAHNFCPERGFGEVPSSKVLRTIASEGRKFGAGLMIISQRPARVDKNILSQCNTQIILKITNPNDLRAVIDSIEGATEGLKEEIKDLPVGVSLVVGVTEHPLVVDVRTRRTEHGGEGIEITEREEKEGGVLLFKKVTKEDDIKRIYKGVEDIVLINYPLWRVKTKYKGRVLFLYIDGITGEFVFQKNGFLERTKNIRLFAEMSPSERAVIVYLLNQKAATIEKIAEDLKMPVSKLKETVKVLLLKKYIETDGYMFSCKFDLDVPDFYQTQVALKPEKRSLKGITLEFMVPSSVAEKTLSVLGIGAESIEEVYYPYWIITRKGSKFAIDAITSRIEIDLIKWISRLL